MLVKLILFLLIFFAHTWKRVIGDIIINWFLLFELFNIRSAQSGFKAYKSVRKGWTNMIGMIAMQPGIEFNWSSTGREGRKEGRLVWTSSSNPSSYLCDAAPCSPQWRNTSSPGKSSSSEPASSATWESTESEFQWPEHLERHDKIAIRLRNS